MVRALAAARAARGPAFVWWVLLAGALAGCGKSQTANEHAAVADVGDEPSRRVAEVAQVEGATPAGPEVQTEAYTLVARPEGEGYTSGQLGQFEIDLASRAGWHVNQDYPIQVALSGPDAVRFAKATLARPDAAEFGQDRARFNVAFTPQATGDQPVRAKVSFAMCTDENCVMHDETLAFVLPVR